MAQKNSLCPKLWIAEGLLDKSNWVWNDNASQTGLSRFAERKLFVPYNSIWNFDRGKLVIPSVFIEYNPFETVVKSHRQVTKVVRRTRSKHDEIRILPAITSFSKEFFKRIYFNARVVGIWDPVQSFGEEGEEDFMHP